MVTLDPQPGESLDTYLVRVIATARRTRTDVLVSWRERIAVVTPRSSVETVRRELEG
jgi:hypothetical protein